jgi:hypothetical protein
MQTLIKSDDIDLSELIEIRKVRPVNSVVMTISPIVITKFKDTIKKIPLKKEELIFERQKAKYIKYLVCDFYEGKTSIKIKHQTIFFIYKFTKLGENYIGKLFNLDHSTINWAKKSVIKDQTYPAYKLEYDRLNNFINNKLLENRSILQFYNKGKLKKEWYSLYNLKTGKYNTDRIINCCTNTNKTYKGYTWTFKP